MTNKKAKTGTNVYLIIGIVFTLIGMVYTGIFLATFFWNMGNATLLFRCIFGGIGLTFFVVGVICLKYDIKRRKRINAVIASGRYVMAEISDISRCYSVSVNGYHPYVIFCQYQDISMNLHVFKSRYLMYNPEPYLKDNMVRVYVDEEDYKYYYVDIDEILPNVIKH